MKSESQDFPSIFSSLLNSIEKKFVDLSKIGKRKANNPAAEGSKNLIINYLPAEMDEDDLRSLFHIIGEIDKIHLMRDMSNRANGPGKSLGYGFVDYKNAIDGERAIDLLNGTQIFNKTIKVSYSRPPSDDIKVTNIYISGLPQSFTQVDLENLYSIYGTIISSKIIENQDKTARNVAFVRFDKRQEANNAIIATNNTKPRGCSNNIQVRYSNTPNTKNLDVMKRRKIADLNEFNRQDGEDYPIYVYNLNPQTDDNALWKLFGAFGAIKNAKAVLDPNTSKCKGFGFVNMKHFDEAVQAIQTLNGYTHDNRVLQVSFKNKNKELDNRGLDLAEVTGRHTLYVYNINPETEDTAIWKLFGQFGAVKNVKVIRDHENQKAKGFAFITMKNFDEAADAVKILNGFTLDNRVLQVSFKTKKNCESAGEMDMMTDIMNIDIPAYVATDRFGSVQIFVYNLAPETEEKNLWKLFGQFGAVKNVKIIQDKAPKFEYKGHAFISMKDYKEASLAVGTLNGTLMEGRVLQDLKINLQSTYLIKNSHSTLDHAFLKRKEH